MTGRILDNRVRGIRQNVPGGYIVGRFKGDGKAQLLSSAALRAMVGPGVIKAIASSTTPTITVQDEGNVTSSVVTTLNFTGAGVTASGAAATATITVPALTVKDEGTTIGAGNVTSLNFVGAGVTANITAGNVTVTIPGVAGNTTLTNTHIFVGNATNIATDVALSGDATLANTGALTLANTAVTPGSYGNATQVGTFTVDSKGRLTAAGNVTISIPSVGGNTTLTNTHIFVGNTTNVATDVALSGDATLANTGALTIANDAVTYAKIQNVSAASKLLGRGSASGSGDVQEISLGINLSMSGTTLSASSGGGGSIDISPFSDGGITKPVAADFTIADDASANHGTGSKTDLASRGVEFTHTQSGTPISSQSFFYVAAVSNTLDTMIAYVAPNFNDRSQNYFYGLAVRDNAGKIHAFGVRNSGTGTIYSDFRYTTISAASLLTNQVGGSFALARPIWFRLQKVSTNFVFSVSLNGETYTTVETVSATAFVGATLNDVGLFILNNLGAAGTVMNVDCFSFART